MNINKFDVFIDEDSNICIINNKNCVLKSDDIDNIIRIIRNWDYDYSNNKIIGEVHYMIKIVYDNREYRYKFDNAFPDNFLELVNYIGGIYER